MWYVCYFWCRAHYKRNVPSNALQNKNQHCSVLQLKGDKFRLFQPVQIKGNRYLTMGYRVPTTWLAVQKWRWSQNKPWLHKDRSLREQHLPRALFSIHTLQQLPKYCSCSRRALIPHTPKPPATALKGGQAGLDLESHHSGALEPSKALHQHNPEVDL